MYKNGVFSSRLPATLLSALPSTLRTSGNISRIYRHENKRTVRNEHLRTVRVGFPGTHFSSGGFGHLACAGLQPF